jgi:hypothetical protein
VLKVVDDIKMVNRKYNKVRNKSFIIWGSCILCGLASVVVDIDHPLFQTVSRAWHSIFAIIGLCFLFIGIGLLIAYFSRLSKIRILKEDSVVIIKQK